MTALRIATRESALALWQARHVAARLQALYPDRSIELVPMTTRGDQILDRPLAAVGGKGLFLKELEVALLEGRADLAVHSFKDVPMELEPGFAIGAVLARADAADAFVSNGWDSLEALPAGARVGTSSLRRQAQLRARRPDLRPVDLRGNVNTRLARLDEGGFEAILLACAGLQRLDLHTRIRARLAPPAWLPAVAQGAIAIECRAGDEAVLQAIAPLHHPATARTVAAERAMNRHLHGSCSVPVAGWCELRNGSLTLAGLVGSPATGTLLRDSLSGNEPEALGAALARRLRDRGADALIRPDAVAALRARRVQPFPGGGRVTAWAAGDAELVLELDDGSRLLYTARSAGAATLAHLQQQAGAGSEELAAFILQHDAPAYELKAIG